MTEHQDGRRTSTEAVVIARHGGPDVLELGSVELRDPGLGEVAVEVAFAGVNFIDTYQRSGLYPTPLPFTPGMEGSGRVSALGSGVSDLAIGQRVAWRSLGGGYAERLVIGADSVVAVPDGVDDSTAAALLFQGLTAHYLATSTYPVGKGDVVVVHAAAGGVGLFLTQVVKIRGGVVVGTVSTPEKAELARTVGADHVVDYADASTRDRSISPVRQWCTTSRRAMRWLLGPTSCSGGWARGGSA
jgi:NADPH2:quinone reductase